LHWIVARRDGIANVPGDGDRARSFPAHSPLAPLVGPASEDLLTEVPEHLLKRSQDRRSALGLGGGDGGGDAAPAAASASTEVTPATSASPAAAAAVVEAKPKAPVFVPPYVQAAERRQKVPVWALAVLGFLPVWAVIYAQSLSAAPSTTKTQLAAGADVYSNCSACHGPTGGGGSGRKLAGHEVLLTFPNIAGQLQFVRLGDAGTAGKYGNPGRDGGQHDALAGFNGAHMPAFKGLTDAELLEVVRHERETLSGELDFYKDAYSVDAAGARLWPSGKPMLNAAGRLVWDDGTTLMFDADGKLTTPPNGPLDETKPPSKA
jgi:mono/diheme cytochrome c family protein